MNQRTRKRMAGRWLALVGAWLMALVTATAASTALLPMPSLSLWAMGLLALEFSLLLVPLALVGVVLAVIAARGRAAAVPNAAETESAGHEAPPTDRPRSGGGAGRTGRRVAATAAGALNAVVLVAALLPAVSAWRTAQDHDVPLSLAGYLDGLSDTADRGPDATVRYARAGGTDLMLDVWRPANPKAASGPLPVVINVHGGAQDTPQSPFPRWDTWLADAGHVVFDVDYRFFRDYDWRSSPGDVKCAIGWVARNAGRYGADPKRITLMGQSAGGYLALLAAYTTAAELPPTCEVPEAELDGVIAWYAPSDMTAEIPPAFRLSEPVRRQLTEETWRLADEDRVRASPRHHIRAGLPRTLLIQGGRDILQPAEDTRALATRLTGAGVGTELVEIPYADHQFDLSWGGFGSQIARHVVLGFLRPPTTP
ncbi:alpha/beta hydrolase [Streptosporangium sp. NPDC048047]|uniref:alpha/beta hydrolase n=1 Tax=Streptosporangium sp. NPDC048047 TaxID=3155748 RepID=UPI0034265417